MTAEDIKFEFDERRSCCNFWSNLHSVEIISNSKTKHRLTLKIMTEYEIDWKVEGKVFQRAKTYHNALKLAKKKGCIPKNAKTSCIFCRNLSVTLK